jgi:capsular polysaccharide biosynthesis protein
MEIDKYNKLTETESVKQALQDGKKLARSGNIQKAIVQFKHITEKGTESGLTVPLRKSSEFYQIQMEVGYELMRLGQYEDSLEAYRIAFSLAGQNQGKQVESSLQYGKALARAGHDQEAIAKFKFVEQITPGSYRILMDLGYELLRIQQYDDANQVFERCLKVTTELELYRKVKFMVDKCAILAGKKNSIFNNELISLKFLIQENIVEIITQINAEQVFLESSNYISYKEYISKDNYLIKLDWGFIVDSRGVIATSDGSLIEDTLPDNSTLNHYLTSGGHLEKLNGVFSFLPCYFTNNYFHWTTQVLPSFLLMKESGISSSSTILLPKSLNQFQLSSLNCLDLSKYNYKVLEPYTIYNIESLFYSTFSGFWNESIHPYLYKVKDKIINNAKMFLDDNELETRPEKIFISRKGSTSRILENAEILEEYLREDGFSILDARDISYYKQVSLMTKAKIIIGEHGAGLTNILYAPTNAYVIEICPNNFVRRFFYELANICGLHHEFLISDQIVDSGKLSNGKIDGKKLKWKIEIIQLKKKIDEFGF